MLEKPGIPDERIISHVLDEYGLKTSRLVFLPLGADVHTVVYRLDAANGFSYFLKLRSGDFAEITVTVPVFLKENGIQAIITPFQTRAGKYWTGFDDFKMILYPFVEGKDGYEVELSPQQWQKFGKVLKMIHTAQLPLEVERQVPRENYSTQWRDLVKGFQVMVESAPFHEPVAANLAGFMKNNREKISHLVERASQLAHELQSTPQELVLCHSDIHAGNLHITPDGRLFIVDWDNPMLSPKEHDLMHFGGSSVWNTRHASLFFRGYGPVEFNQRALAYYRFERIIQDIAEFCKQLLLTDEGGMDREQSLAWFTSQFLPGHEVEIAGQTDGKNC